MAVLNIRENILENASRTVEVKPGITVEQAIRDNCNYVYDTILYETYNANTGVTEYEYESDEGSVGVSVYKGDEQLQLDYVIQNSDVINVIISPKGLWANVGAVLGVVAGIGTTIVGAVTANPLIVAAGLALTVGAPIAGHAAGEAVDQHVETVKELSAAASTSNEYTTQVGAKMPDARDASNSNLTNNVFPVVYGKHELAPFIVGSPYAVNSGSYGKDQSIFALFAVSYAPVLLSDFKIDDLVFAKNLFGNGNDAYRLVKGIIGGTAIEEKFKKDKINIEILQQKTGDLVDYGTLYPYAKIQTKVGASLLNLPAEKGKDGTVYMGSEFEKDLMTNTVRFSEQYPMVIEVEIDIPNGLFRTYQKTENVSNGTETTDIYERIPLWLAVQWNLFDDTDIPAGNDPGGSSWHSFSKVEYFDDNNEKHTITPSQYTAEEREADRKAHNGSTYTKNNINEKWVDAYAFNIKEVGAYGNSKGDAEGSSDKVKGGKNEVRLTFTVNLKDYYDENIASTNKPFKDWFECNGRNTLKTARVRVIRISPNYTDEMITRNSGSRISAKSFADKTEWSHITTTPFDYTKLCKDGQVVAKRPLSEEDMRKLCVFAFRASVTQSGNISGKIGNIHVTAQAFQPYFDTMTRKWFPESISPKKKYYKDDNTEIKGNSSQTAKQIFENERLNGKNAKVFDDGNNFRKEIDSIVFSEGNKKSIKETNIFSPTTSTATSLFHNIWSSILGKITSVADGLYDTLHTSYGVTISTCKYLCNNPASAFLMAGIGPQNGNYAFGYDRFNMKSLSDMYEFCEAVTDGTVDSSNNELVMKFECNAYIFKPIKLETMFQKIATTGRALFTLDSKQRIAVVVDKPVAYPVAMINQQNSLSSTNSISYEDPVSGLMVSFEDEEDAYDTNTLFVMNDGESKTNPRGVIESYTLEYVTNRNQLHSLARYILATRVFSRELLTRKIGMEGYSLHIGDVVLISDDTLSIGTDLGGRIEELIYSTSYNPATKEITKTHIAGFVCTETFEPIYGGEKPYAVSILLPHCTFEDRVIELEIADENTTVTEHVVKNIRNGELYGDEEAITYTAIKGVTNVFLFKDQIPITSAKVPKEGNITAFGLKNNTTAMYRIVSIKPDGKHNFDLSLIKYQNNFYHYGVTLPTFENNITMPQIKESKFDGMNIPPEYMGVINTQQDLIAPPPIVNIQGVSI